MKAVLFIDNYDTATAISIIIKSACPEINVVYTTQYLGLAKERPMEDIAYYLGNDQLIENFWENILSAKEATIIVSDLVLGLYDKLVVGISEASYKSFGNKLLFEPLSRSNKATGNLGILFISENTSLKNNWKIHLNGIDYLEGVNKDFTTTERMYDNPSRIGGIFKRLANLLE